MEWTAGKKELRLEYFYRLMRKKHHVLIDADGNPEGGQWNFDQDNRKPYPKKGPGIIDAPAAFEVDAITKEVLAFVAKTYPDHPGSLGSFNWPVTRNQDLQALSILSNTASETLAFIKMLCGRIPHLDGIQFCRAH